MSTLWTISMLGGLSAQRPGHQPIRFQVRKTNSLLAYLAYHLNEDVSKDILIETLWPETDLMRARHSLSESLSILRRYLEPPDIGAKLVIQLDHSCIRLNGLAVATDLHRLKLAIAKFTRSTDAEEQLTLLRRAASIYTGELLPGFFDDWVITEREHITQSYLRIFRVLINLLTRAGHTEEALEQTLRSITIAADSEELHAHALKILIAMGRESDAIRHFEQYRERRNRIDGEVPGHELCRVMEPLKHRLKSVVPMRQREQRRKPAKPAVETAVLNLAASETAGLPTMLTRFFGREQEIASIANLVAPRADGPIELLESGPARMITITGLGGCGKTRLAIEACRKLDARGDFGKHIAFVPLSGLYRHDDIPQAIAEALHLAIGGSSQSVSLQIREALRKQQWLLILDNCEHLPAAGPFVQSLLEEIPELRIVATSRMPLGIYGEHLYALQPLVVPVNVRTPEALYEFPSVQMFVNRAQAVCHDFQITARNAETISLITQRLEGVPLAIELAAAHALTLTPSQILSALQDRFGLLTSRNTKCTRHRALKETLDWSFELLSKEAQEFFVAMSVFQGGFTADAARAVSGKPHTRELLTDLAERSLIVPKAGREVMRFSLLDSLREYAAERADEDVRQSVASRHAAYYLHLVELAAPDLRTNARATALGVLDEAHPNVLAALDFVAGTPDELTFVAMFWPYWEMRGYIEPGTRLLERAVQNCNEDHPDFAEALHGVGVFRDLRDDLGGAECALRQSLEIVNGNKLERGRVLNSLAVLLDKRGSHDSARKLGIEALTLMREANSERDVATCLNTLGMQHRFAGELLVAEIFFAEAQTLFESLEDWPSAAAALHNMGCIASDLGNLRGARTAFERGLALFRDLNRPAWIAHGLQSLGDTVGRQGDFRAANSMLLECLDIRHRLRDYSGIAAAVEALAAVAHGDGDTTRAVRLVAGADALRTRLETPVASSDLTAYKRDIIAFRSVIQEPDFEAAWAFGSALSLDRLVTYARDGRLLPRDAQDSASSGDLDIPILRQSAKAIS